MLLKVDVYVVRFSLLCLNYGVVANIYQVIFLGKGLYISFIMMTFITVC